MRFFDFFKKGICDNSVTNAIYKHFNFLLVDYGFQIDKKELGNAVNKNGEFFFYGPVYHYYLYNDNVCIHILELVQRRDFDIYITTNATNDQPTIRNGIVVEDKFCYDWESFATRIKHELAKQNTIYNIPISKQPQERLS